MLIQRSFFILYAEMKITGIQKQKKQKKRYNLFLDGDFAFGLYDDTILKYGLRTNDELSEDKIKEIREYDEFSFGKYIAYAFLAYKARSRKEIIKKLKERKISENIIEDILKLLTEQKYLDDSSYAKLYLENIVSSKPAGRRLIKLKLGEKGIDKETADKIIEENYDEESEYTAARKLLKKYSVRLKNKPGPEKKRKSFSYLISRGFDFDLANKIINETEE